MKIKCPYPYSNSVWEQKFGRNRVSYPYKLSINFDLLTTLKSPLLSRNEDAV